MPQRTAEPAARVPRNPDPSGTRCGPGVAQVTQVTQVTQVQPGSRAWTSVHPQGPSLLGVPLQCSQHGAIQPASWKRPSRAGPAGGPCPETSLHLQLADFGFVEFGFIELKRFDLQPVGSAGLPSWSVRAAFLVKS